MVDEIYLILTKLNVCTHRELNSDLGLSSGKTRRPSCYPLHYERCTQLNRILVWVTINIWSLNTFYIFLHHPTKSFVGLDNGSFTLDKI
jgi:hypothetical protein